MISSQGSYASFPTLTPSPSPAHTSQFESSTLNAALLLLDLRELVSEERQTAVKVARAAAGMVRKDVSMDVEEHIGLLTRGLC